MAADLAHAYENYYTHVSAVSDRPGSIFKRAYLVIKRGYLARQFGYSYPMQSALAMLLGSLLFLFPIRREAVDSEVRHLRAHRGGRLLDVGCGSGEWLSSMRDLGWTVQGLDFDQRAVSVAAHRGLNVDCGSLEDQGYSNESFDAITLNHVIEHLPDPVSTLRECRRILKPGGRIMLYTPNSGSLGHSVFGKYWRGLEPPRHLFLFSPDSMNAVLSQAGFNHVILRTTNSEYMWQQSVGLWKNGLDTTHQLPMSLKALSRLMMLMEQAILAVKQKKGECLAVTGVKM